MAGGKKLSQYERKRSFEKTPEPRGRTRKKAAKGNRFVIQEHHARRLHWDLRLEHGGTLVSFALPRGVPQDPKHNRLAVHTEDHPLEYLDFEGDIPEGQYGAGRMRIWDRGTYEAEKFRDDEVIAVFDGERVRGKYALFQTNGDNWMIHRMDPPADRDREPMLTLGTIDYEIWPDHWTVVTKDRKRTAQFEHTILVTDSGTEILTLP